MICVISACVFSLLSEVPSFAMGDGVCLKVSVNSFVDINVDINVNVDHLNLPKRPFALFLGYFQYISTTVKKLVSHLQNPPTALFEIPCAFVWISRSLRMDFTTGREGRLSCISNACRCISNAI